MSDRIMDGTLTPYLGKDFKTKTAALEHFRAGMDWTYNNISSQWDGKPCSIRDCQVGEMVKLRYDGLRQLTFYTVTADDLDYKTQAERRKNLTK